jgi:hypothetical protein
MKKMKAYKVVRADFAAMAAETRNYADQPGLRRAMSPQPDGSLIVYVESDQAELSAICERHGQLVTQ